MLYIRLTGGAMPWRPRRGVSRYGRSACPASARCAGSEVLRGGRDLRLPLIGSQPGEEADAGKSDHQVFHRWFPSWVRLERSDRAGPGDLVARLAGTAIGTSEPSHAG